MTHFADVGAIRVSASISRDGAAVATNEMVIQATSSDPGEGGASRALLLKIPWSGAGNNGGVERGDALGSYRLHLEASFISSFFLPIDDCRKHKMHYSNDAG